ncbi:hypothetical protein FIBSPDRAFT_898395 [Athelia psychrophila]|uniref:PPM-type phosphatase domain-containing protein n=1 Tax=Athelia psychrophila TaxID=1759441 RepID=A0A166B1D7_9AGAM|nr:hypothetical protein FIBSPDRAFT_898395 [Fibularhizoctonia sp. CBS 109695]
MFIHEAIVDDAQQLEDFEFISKPWNLFDDVIAGDVLDLFPGTLEGLANLPDDYIRNKYHQRHTPWRRQLQGGKAFHVHMVLYPDHKNLCVTNLGDCTTVIVTKTGQEFGSCQTRIPRGAGLCLSDHRVLRAIAPFRDIGGTPLKQPPKFTRRILYNLYPGSQNTSP